MNCEFGEILSAERDGNDLSLVAFRYVAVALDRDDPYLVARFVGVEPGSLSDDDVREISLARDVYSCEIHRLGDSVLVKFIAQGGGFEFRCRDFVCSTRYYTKPEIEAVLKWLPSRCSGQQLQGYLDALRDRGFAVSFGADGVVVLSEG